MFQVSGFKVSGFGVFDVFWAYGLRFWFSWFGDFRCRGLGVSGFGLPGFRFLVSTYKCLGFLGEDSLQGSPARQVIRIRV